MKDDLLSVGDVVELSTESLAYGGDAVAHYEGLAVFIPLAAAGERLRVRITERKKSFARAVIEEIIAPSTSRRAPPCQYFGKCGGCQLQHVSYDTQLEAKAGFVRDALARIGKIDWPHKIEVKSAAEFAYRTRAQIKIAQTHGRELLVGFNRAGSHSVCDIASCPLLVPELDCALGSLRSTLKRAHTSKELSTLLAGLSEVEMAAGDAGVAFEPELPGLPAGVVEQRVGQAIYSFIPATFFQVNRLLLDDLITVAVGSDKGRLAIDLYAGVGLFSVQLARLYDRVIGVESDPRSAMFATRNISVNRVANVEFYNQRVEVWLKELMAHNPNTSAPDLLLLNPPRSGAVEAIPHIALLKPARINYVSCDPTTLARDLRKLLDAGYEISNITAFDLFPQTYHVETVAELKALRDLI